jgi:hypothetical protein
VNLKLNPRETEEVFNGLDVLIKYSLHGERKKKKKIVAIITVFDDLRKGSVIALKGKQGYTI